MKLNTINCRWYLTLTLALLAPQARADGESTAAFEPIHKSQSACIPGKGLTFDKAMGISQAAPKLGFVLDANGEKKGEILDGTHATDSTELKNTVDGHTKDWGHRTFVKFRPGDV